MFRNIPQISVPQQLSQLRLPVPPLSRNVKLTLISLTLGLALGGYLAAFFRRRRARSSQLRKKFEEREKKKRSAHGNRSQNARLPRIYSPNVNGDVGSRSSSRRSASPASLRSSLLRNRSLSSSTQSLGAGSDASTITHSGLDTSLMTPLQLCQTGLENLSDAIAYWEEAITKLSYVDDQQFLAIPDPDTAALQHRLEDLLEMAYAMQDRYERQAERHADHVAMDTAISAFAEVDRMFERRSLDDMSSDQDSFVSATDMANLADLENNRELLHNFPLYEAGLLELKHGTVPCRTLRPEMVQCISDVEFLGKLYGLRLAFDEVFRKSENRDFFAETGKKLVGDLLIRAEKDPSEFYACYDKLLDYCSVPENWPSIEEELRGRGVKCFTFYDIVLDFILMDAFDDLEHPPSSVTAVVNNRWLSNGFKETALATACWSVLKAKRRLLKFQNGFIALFYSLSEHTSPVLAWGFLGPPSEVKSLCLVFKTLVEDFLRQIFSFDKARYTAVEDLAEDIMRIARTKSETAIQKLAAPVAAS